MEIISSISNSLIVGIAVGSAAGYIGSLMVLKRMALVGDALSHVALPGIALGLVLGTHPIAMAFVTLISGVGLIWFFERKTKLSTEALVGIIFTGSLALGILLIPDEELLESLFGNIRDVSLIDTGIALLGSLGIFFVLRSFYSRMVLSVISEDLAKSRGISVSTTHFIYLILVAAIVALGIKVVGTLLMGALVVIPAVASRSISPNLSRYAYGSMIIGGLSAFGGILLASQLHLSPGPLVVLFAIGVFLLTFFFRR